MSDNAGCAWLFGILVAGFIAFVWIAGQTTAGQQARDMETYRICVENGGSWDGFWKSCARGTDR